MFLEREGQYIQLDGNLEGQISSVFSDADTVHFIKEGPINDAHEELIMPCYYGNTQIGRVPWFLEERPLALKLRVQDLFGFPVSCVDIMSGKTVDDKCFLIHKCIEKPGMTSPIRTYKYQIESPASPAPSLNSVCIPIIFSGSQKNV